VTEAGESFLFYKRPLRSIAEQACQDGVVVTLDVKRSSSGNRYVDGIRRVVSNVGDSRQSDQPEPVETVF
jgi:hypothetical protein